MQDKDEYKKIYKNILKEVHQREAKGNGGWKNYKVFTRKQGKDWKGCRGNILIPIYQKFWI